MNAVVQKHHGQDIVDNSLEQLILPIKSFFDKLSHIASIVRNVFKTTVKYMHFLSVVEFTDAYQSLPKKLQEAGYIVAAATYIEFDGRVESIILKVGDDGYPEVTVRPCKISSEDLIEILDDISDMVWELSEKNDDLLMVSITVDR